MNIVIIGYGKAGAFHRNAYLELREETIFEGEIFFIDNKIASDTQNGEEVYKDIDELLKKYQLIPEETIIDICLPTGIMLHTIQQFKERGFCNFICEKPFVLYKESCINAEELLKGINLYIVENYLYSQITCFAKEMLSKYNLKAKLVISEFSKDRQKDSFENRAFSSEGSTLSVFEVEVPHQLYMCESLFGEIRRVIYKQCEDMVVKNKCMKDHGSGCIICTNNDGSTYIIYSNLQKEKRRNVYVMCEDQYILDLHYSTIKTDKFQCNYGGFLYKDGKLIESVVIDHDNNMYEMLKNYYLGFLKKTDKKFATYNDLLNTSKLFESIKKEENQNKIFDMEVVLDNRNIYYNLDQNSINS